MSNVNMNRAQIGFKLEAVAGTPEVLVDADFNVEMLDQEPIQMAPDKASAGMVANGTLSNSATEYMRTNGGTVAVKFEMKKVADATVKPNYFKALELAGWATSVYDDGGEDKWQALYDGTPDCSTGTFVTTFYDCAGDRYTKSLAGGIIADGKIGFEGLGAPLIFSGTVSGKFILPTYDVTGITSTVDAGDAIQHTGTVNTIDATPYNITKSEFSQNTSAVVVPDSSDANGTNIGYYRFGEGDPSGTFSASPLGDEVADYADYASNTIASSMVMENDDFILTVTEVQFTDIQDTNESGSLIQDKPVKNQTILFQLK